MARLFNEDKQYLDKIMTYFQYICIQELRVIRLLCSPLFLKGGYRFRVLVRDDALQQLRTKVEKVRSALNRAKIKIAFFGSTSSGKSASINALLGMRVMPSLPGSTTECIIEVKGSNDDDLHVYTVTENGVLLSNIDSIWGLQQALLLGDFGSSPVLTIEYPKGMCPLLEEDIVLVDIPVLNHKPLFDDMVYEQCSDCDAFVAVVDAEKSFGKYEKDFFASVSERIPAFSIFFAFNKWDRVLDGCEIQVKELKTRVFRNNDEKKRAYEHLLSYPDVVRKQHHDSVQSYLERCDEARNQPNCVFFYSAEKVITSKKSGHDEHLEEFKKFEDALLECASETARLNKLRQQWKIGLEMVRDMRNDMVGKDLAEVENLETFLRSSLNDRRRISTSMDKEIEVARNNLSNTIRLVMQELDANIMACLEKENKETRAPEQVFSYVLNKLQKQGTINSTLAKIERLYTNEVNGIFGWVVSNYNNQPVLDRLEQCLSQRKQLSSQEETYSCKHCINAKRQCFLNAVKTAFVSRNLKMNDICTANYFTAGFDKNVTWTEWITRRKFWGTTTYVVAWCAFAGGVIMGVVCPVLGFLEGIDGAPPVMKLAQGGAIFGSVAGVVTGLVPATLIGIDQACLDVLNERFTNFTFKGKWKKDTKVESKVEKMVLKEFDDFSKGLKESSKRCLDISIMEEVVKEVAALKSKLKQVDENCLLFEESLKILEKNLYHNRLLRFIKRLYL